MTQKEIGVEMRNHVAIVEMQRPPHNEIDIHLVRQLADAVEALDEVKDCRAIVLAAQGKSFCAGGHFRKVGDAFTQGKFATSYEESIRLFRTRKPIVAAVHGAAIGGGLGLALTADFRVTCPQARFAANFARLGINPGFGLCVTLPELIGRNQAELLFYTGRWLTGEQAVAIGLANVLVPQEQVREAAVALAAEISECAPLAVEAARSVMRRGLADRLQAAAAETMETQRVLRESADFREGVKAAAERRLPRFEGR